MQMLLFEARLTAIKAPALGKSLVLPFLINDACHTPLNKAKTSGTSNISPTAQYLVV